MHDVQVCVSGLSLVPEDLEWFENEECEGTRVRTVEPYEAEWAQMLRKEVVGVENPCAALAALATLAALSTFATFSALSAGAR